MRVLALLLLLAISAAAQPQKDNFYDDRIDTTAKAPPKETPRTYSLPFIRVEGNRFVDEQGRTVVFRGVSIADPDRLERGRNR